MDNELRAALEAGHLADLTTISKKLRNVRRDPRVSRPVKVRGVLPWDETG